MREVPRAFGQLMDQVKRSAAAGIRPPRFAHEGVIDQAGKVITGAPFTDGKDSALWADAQAKADALVEGGQDRCGARAGAEGRGARGAGRGGASRRSPTSIAWYKADLPNAAVNPSGVGTTHPDGAAYYAERLRASTTTDMTAEQVHQIGLDEVARIRGEMEALKDKVGFKGDLKAFFKFVDTDPRFKFPNTDAGRQAYIDDATQAIATIKQQLPNYFGLLPKADLVVKRVEPFREVDGAAQHYYPSTPDGSRPGIYYAHLSDMSAMPKTTLEVIAYHEGLPGHHMQIAIAQELQGVPEFRKQAGFNAYAEGWGLYSEWLAREMPGTYTDPYSEFGRLTSEMWRAIRLVVDTGLHAKGWTQEQAVAYFSANSSIPLPAIQAEVRRYIVWPGQATRLQDRHAQDPAAAREGRSGTGRGLRHPRLPRCRARRRRDAADLAGAPHRPVDRGREAGLSVRCVRRRPRTRHDRRAAVAARKDTGGRRAALSLATPAKASVFTPANRPPLLFSRSSTRNRRTTPWPPRWIECRRMHRDAGRRSCWPRPCRCSWARCGATTRTRRAYELQWSNFASWLVAGGMVFLGIALVFAIVDLVRGGRSLLYFVLLLAGFVLGFINALVHARDAYAVMPTGLVLSLVVLVLVAAATWMAF